MTQENYLELAADSLELTNDERDVKANLFVEYADLATRIDGLRVTDTSGRTIEAIMPEDFGALAELVAATGNNVRIKDLQLTGFTLTSEHAHRLQAIAREKHCFMGDAMTVGHHMHRRTRQHRLIGNQVVAVCTDGSTAPLSLD